MPTATQPPFDARWLTGPVEKADVRAYAAAASGGGSRVATKKAILYAVVAAVGLFIVAPRVVGAFWGTGSGGFGVLPAIAVVAVIIVVMNRAMKGAAHESDYRLHRFAQANGMEFLPQDADPALPGMIFGEGRARHAPDRVRGTRPRFVEFANYRYTTGSGKNSRTHTWGYVAIKLDAPLPHMVLDAVGNNGLFGSNLPAAFSADQRLGLEGDFDAYFSLYCPAGYETDALYLFTPDVMARLIDSAAQLDIEIVDDWLFLYSKRDLVTLDPNTWAWLFSVVAVLLDKIKRWERWRDERLTTRPAARALPPAGATVPFAEDTTSSVPVPPVAPARLKGVAHEGRRLDRAVRWRTVLVVVGVVVAALVLFMGPALAAMLSGL